MALTSQRTLEGVVFLALFTACIPAANWIIQNVGTTCVPNGPCLIPVAFGLMGAGLAYLLLSNRHQRTPDPSEQTIDRWESEGGSPGPAAHDDKDPR